jgi:hypothetical protein
MLRGSATKIPIKAAGPHLFYVRSVANPGNVKEIGTWDVV